MMATSIMFLSLLVILIASIMSTRPFTWVPVRRSRCSGAATTAAENKTGSKGVYLTLSDPNALNKFVHIKKEYLHHKDPCGNREKVILCIGSDRCTGDCLGPFVGSSLENSNSGKVTIFGTVQDPVHALNLSQCLKQIKERHNQPVIIAVDASLSHNKQDVGKVWIYNGALNPGNAVDKHLPAVGDISVTGIVNEFQEIHSTRLYNVTGIARFITRGLQNTLDLNCVTSYTETGTERMKDVMSCH